MKKAHIMQILSTLLAAVLILSFTGCKHTGILTDKEDLLSEYEVSQAVPKYDFTTGEATSPESYQQYCEKLTDFSLTLLNSASSDEVPLVSPLATTHTLSLLLNGASSDTESQIKKLFASGLDSQTLNACNHYLTSRLTAFNTEDFGYYEESALWLNDSFSVKSPFLQAIKNYYSSHIVRRILADEGSLDKINALTAESTKNIINNIITEPLKETTILGISASTISDSWVTPYTADRLSTRDFLGTKGTQSATYMTSNERYISSDFAEGFIKSLKNTPIKFAAIMPKGDTSARELLSTLTYNRLSTMLTGGSATDFCTASIPQFEMESSSSIDSTLKALGMTKAYLPNEANFSFLTSATNVALTSIRTGTFVEITPYGTVKNTDTVDSGGEAFTKTDRELLFNKPFVFMFFDNESGVPIIMGIVNNI